MREITSRQLAKLSQIPHVLIGTAQATNEWAERNGVREWRRLDTLEQVAAWDPQPNTIVMRCYGWNPAIYEAVSCKLNTAVTR